MRHLLVEVPMRGSCSIWSRKPLANEIVSQSSHSIKELLRSRRQGRPDIVLMKLMTAFRRRSDESDSKAASPVAEEIRQAGRFVILVRPQLRIGDHVRRHEEEAVP